MSKFIKFLIFFLILSCKSSTDLEIGEKTVYEPDAKKRAQMATEKSGGLFGIIGGKDKDQEVNFKNSNVMWRATLKSLEFLPLQNVDYNGGIIIYDWYSQANNSKEQIKISVQFLNNEVRADSIKIIAHKKICDNTNKCSDTMIDQKFADSIKDSILNSARLLKIQEAKKEKK